MKIKNKTLLKSEFISLIRRFKNEEISLDDFSYSSGNLLRDYISLYGVEDDFVLVLESASELSFYVRDESRLGTFINMINKVFSFYKNG